MSSANKDELLRFISGYESSQPAQSIAQIQGDFQLAGLITLLHSYLSRYKSPKILDYGCGNGVLMAKLSEIDAFSKYPNLKYIGFDFGNSLAGARETAFNLKILSHVQILEYYDNWIENLNSNCIVINRNVMHEFTINKAAKFMHEICRNLQEESVFLMQDMTNLPVAEKSKAGWFGVHLANILEKGGIKTNFTPDISKSGVDIFLIEGHRCDTCNLTEENIMKLLIEARKEQLDVIGLKYEYMTEKPDNKALLFRLNHDIATINLMLKSINISADRNERTEYQESKSPFKLPPRVPDSAIKVSKMKGDIVMGDKVGGDKIVNMEETKKRKSGK